MGIFYKTDDSGLQMSYDSTDWTYPQQLIYCEYMNQPHDDIETGAKNAAFLLAQYAEAIQYQLAAKPNMSQDEVISNFYTNVSNKDKNGYISLRDGMDAVCMYIHDNSICKNITSKNIIWTATPDACKRYLHRNNYMIVEMKADAHLLNYEGHSQSNSFLISKMNALPVTDKYTKCFILCGYDKDGFVLFNSLGKAYGSYGYVKVSNDVFKHDFIKGATINNIFG